jgi:hypothetical protein
VEAADQIFFPWLNKAFWLLHIQLFLQITVEECGFYV